MKTMLFNGSKEFEAPFFFSHRHGEVTYYSTLENKGHFSFWLVKECITVLEIYVSKKNCASSQVTHSHCQHDYTVEGTFKHIILQATACYGAVELTVTVGTNRKKRTSKASPARSKYLSVFQALGSPHLFFVAYSPVSVKHEASFLMWKRKNTALDPG